MTSTSLRLVVLGSDAGWLDRPTSALQSAFEVVRVENVEQARRLLAESGGRVLVAGTLVRALGESPAGPVDPATAALLEHVGEGVGVVGASGELTWCSRRLAARSEELRGRFVEQCRAALDQLARAPATASRTLTLTEGNEEYELVVSPAASDAGGRVTAVTGMLWDVTSTKRLQQKIDAIDAAGAELLRIERDAVSGMNMAERLRLLEQRIVHSVRDLLEFDNFEIRLLDHHTRRLELVVAVGLAPLKIGEVIHAEPEGNGISGYVASTGRSYICTDALRDPRYQTGLDNAASSLTVPLYLHDEVIGVFNVESNEPNAFDDNDRQFAEIFGRYVAMAMHILDLLVVERYTTNEQLSANVLSELSTPVQEITAAAARLGEQEVGDPQIQADLDIIRAAAAALQQRMSSATSGPRSILGAEQELRKHEADPVFMGRRVLVADNEEEIRQTLQRILEQKGCQVCVCENGVQSLEALQSASREGRPFEIVVSDIKMPDRNGYEIFRTARDLGDGTQVILMTGFGYDPHHSIIRASQEGLHALLFKPFKAAQLLSIMKRAFEGQGAAAE